MTHFTLMNDLKVTGDWVYLNLKVLPVPGMQSTPRTMEEPMEEKAVGASAPSQSHLQDLVVHASDTPASCDTHKQHLSNA